MSALPTPHSLAPVVLRHERDHAFARRAERRRGCDVCGRGRRHPDHLGAPPSLNVFVSQNAGQVFAYREWKKVWSEILLVEVAASGLPRSLSRVLVEGRVCFPNKNRRDQGNYRFLLEKALGDTLTEGGWLADDSWEQYEFGNLTYVYERGRSWTELVLFPGRDEVAS